MDRLTSADGGAGRSSPQRFLRHRSERAREQAVRHVELAVQQLANLVLNATALADRMEARQTRGPEDEQALAARVLVLRQAARAGQAAIQRESARAGQQDPDQDVDQDAAPAAADGWRR